MINGTVYAACRDIAVLSRDAKYLLLDSTTLEIRDSGNLWWLGFRQIDYVYPGSNLNYSAISSETYVDVSTGNRIHVSPSIRMEPTPDMPNVDVYVLENLGRNYQSQENVAFADFTELGIANVSRDSRIRLKWMQNEGVLVFWASTSRIQHSYALLSSFLEPIFQFGYESNVFFAQCRIEEDYYFSANQKALRVNVGTGQLEIPSWPGPEYEMTYTFDGCIVLSHRDVENRGFYGPGTLYRLTNYATGETLSEFVLSTQRARSHLFADGSRWLMQEVESLPDGRTVATPRFKLVDTLSGRIVLESKLETGDAILPYYDEGRRFCDPGSDEERVIAIDGQTIYLIDAYSLTVMASTTLPFEEGMFVF